MECPSRHCTCPGMCRATPRVMPLRLVTRLAHIMMLVPNGLRHGPELRKTGSKLHSLVPSDLPVIRPCGSYSL